ncbi:MAG: hypothetical protein ACR2JM_13580 [Mycobacterium sp.]
MKVGHKPTSAKRPKGAPARRRGGEGPVRESRSRAGTRTRPQEPRGVRQGPQSAPAPRPADGPVRPKTTDQAKARAKARKAKAPKAIRPPLRERLLARLENVDLRPRALLARIPFVVLVIGALALGLGITLWLSTDSAQRSYQLGTARALNDALTQQKEALERDVLEALSAPALADAARNLGMIQSRDTAHLVQDPGGNWIVVGQPKPAEGAPPPPLNFKLPDEKPPVPAKPAPPAVPAPKPGAAGEVPVRLVPVPPAVAPVGPAGALPALVPPVTAADPHALGGTTMPGPAPLPGPATGGLTLVPAPAAAPAGDTLVAPPAAAVPLPVPTVAAVPPATDVAAGVAPVGVAH